MEGFALVQDRTLPVRVRDDGVEVEGRIVAAELAPSNGSPVRSVRLGGRSLRVLPRRQADGSWVLEVEGQRHHAEVLDRGQDAVRRARKAAGAGSGPAPLKAPMPGLVVRVEVAPGDEVTAGQGVVIVEAMKMENELKAPAAARVRAVHAVPGTPVEKDAVLVEFEPLEGKGEGEAAEEGARGAAEGGRGVDHETEVEG